VPISVTDEGGRGAGASKIKRSAGVSPSGTDRLTALLRSRCPRTVPHGQVKQTETYCVRSEVFTAVTVKNGAVAFRSQANYTDRADATCRRSSCQLLRVQGYRMISAAGPHGRCSLFFRPEPLLFIQVAPQLSSRD
jgi:hypothetical protein